MAETFDLKLLQSGMLKNKRSQRLHGQLAQHYAIRILSGELPVGHAFPGEIELSEQLKVSRTLLREAFRILSAKGLVESRPKFGTRVAPRAQWSVLDPDLMGWQFQAEPSREFVRDLFELRSVVEPAAAAFAAIRSTPDKLAAMAQALDEMQAHNVSSEAWREADKRFHMAMLEAAGNTMLAGLASSIIAAISWTTLLKARWSTEPRDPIVEHRALFDAIAARDPEAAREAMELLIEQALSDTELVLVPEENQSAQ